MNTDGPSKPILGDAVNNDDRKRSNTGGLNTEWIKQWKYRRKPKKHGL